MSIFFKRIVSKLIILLLLAFYQIFFSQNILYAATCNFILDPQAPTQDSEKVKVTITSPDLASGQFRVVLSGPENTDNNQTGKIFNKDGVAVEFNKAISRSFWPAGNYTVYLIKNDRIGDPKSISECSKSFVISPTKAQSSCNIKIANNTIDPDTGVAVDIGGLKDETYGIYINNEKRFENRLGNNITRLDLGKFDVGVYSLEVRNTCGIAGISCINNQPRNQCQSVAFQVSQRGSNKGGQVIPKTSNQASPSGGISASGESCDPKTGGPGSGGVMTAIGCVSTEPKTLIEGILRFSVAVGGGIAFLLMLAGVFQFITSAGNPDRLKKATEQITNAVTGLLFIIFSVLLLRIIGVDILQLIK